MADVTYFEYGVLRQTVGGFGFVGHGKNYSGPDDLGKTLYAVLNKLADDGWEAHLYCEQDDDFGEFAAPTWIMRRVKKS